MDKTCTVCKIVKLTSEFYVRDASLNRLHSQCKGCYKLKRTSFMEEHYKRYGDQYRTRARIRKSAIKSQRQEQLYGYLSDKSCAVCGIDDIRVLEFDHLDAKNKSFGISRAVNVGYSWESILEEINKCQVLCSNCHKIRTAEQQNWKKWRLGRVVRQESAKL